MVTRTKIGLMVAVTVVGLTVGLSACSARRDLSPPIGSNSPTSAALVDPFAFVSSGRSGFPVAQDADALVHSRETGPATLRVPRPGPEFTKLTFFLSCSPASRFTVTMDKFFSGGCVSSTVENSGGIPLPAGDGPLTVSVDIPRGVQYWVVAVPTP